ncbi:alpha/beta hydrolase family protein [Pedobacter xixiisoli]|uniref:Acetyl xylan esterase (AXE1) n=1 Tax=Pedobacter xixiisoli TaxID=1476464 RepID=A0A285ZXN7_9SPHI|nr:alpha/beta hydrolase family protein [Pedobacter xixiisoli]SOD14405.1 Acetyl xylan esterase (AXE1) [Pedobacter xixiisoli]
MFKQAAFFFLFLGYFSANAQKQYNVLDWKTDVSLNTYLVQQMHEQYGQRRTNFNAALKSKKQTLAYIKTVRQKANEVFGKLPKKAALNPQITGIVEQDGYRIEKVIYQSFENHHVTANLYVPNGSGKFPAVLLFCGHEDVSKATESYQKTAILLAKNGFVVFVIDPISQSERVQLTNENGKSLTRGSTTEHTLLNLSSNLVGTSVAAYELFDNQCGLDYLVTRKEVDANKIGVTGNSGGGMQTIYFAAIDDRVKVVVPCSYLASRENTLATTGAADGCAQIPNEGAHLLEMSDYLIAAAPKPTLVLAGRYDFIDYNGTQQSFDDLKRVYTSLGEPEKVSLFTYDDGHGISKPKRENAVQWFRKWLYNDDSAIVEPDLKVLTDGELFATEKSKVNLSFPNEITVQQHNRKLSQEYLKNREDFGGLTIEAKQQHIRNLLNIDVSNQNISSENVGEVKGKFALFQKVIIRKQNEIPLPVLVYYPQKEVRKVVIWISDGGKNKLVDSAALMREYIDQQDVAVVFADLRGTGETADKPELNDPKYFSKDYRNAMLALHIGKPLLGQRTQDIQTILQFIAADQKMKQASIEVNAKGNLGLVALHAAFLDHKISSVNLDDCIGSYKEILEQPLAKDRYGLVLHGQLAHYDIPDLIRWMTKTKVQIN